MDKSWTYKGNSFILKDAQKNNGLIELMQWKQEGSSKAVMSLMPSDYPPGTSPRMAINMRKASPPPEHSIAELFTMSPSQVKKLSPEDRRRHSNMIANTVLHSNPDLKQGSKQFNEAVASWQNSKLSLAEEYAINAKQMGNETLAMPSLRQGTKAFATLERKASALGYSMEARGKTQPRRGAAAQQAAIRNGGARPSNGGAPKLNSRQQKHQREFRNIMDGYGKRPLKTTSYRAGSSLFTAELEKNASDVVQQRMQMGEENGMSMGMC